MASIMTDKEKILKKPIKHLIIGSILLVSGFFCFKYLSAIIEVSKDFIDTFKDSFNEFDFNAPSIIAMALVLSSVFFIGKACMGLIRTFRSSDVEKTLSKLPNTFFIFNNLNIEQYKPDHIIICPKGLFTVDSSNWNSKKSNPQKNTKQYAMVKHAILNSKALNDYLQKKKIGNYFVNTIIIFSQWDEKVKGNFSDIPILKPEQLTEHFSSLPDKYSAEECKKIADALKNSFTIHSNDLPVEENTETCKIEAVKIKEESKA